MASERGMQSPFDAAGWIEWATYWVNSAHGLSGKDATIRSTAPNRIVSCPLRLYGSGTRQRLCHSPTTK
jgi:hypothetical protein